MSSALGQKQTLSDVCVMPALTPKADVERSLLDVRFVPKADVPLHPCHVALELKLFAMICPITQTTSWTLRKMTA